MRGSMTIAIAALASVPRTVFSSTSSAVYWMSSSSVRRTSAPETRLRLRDGLESVTGRRSRTITSLPGLAGELLVVEQLHAGEPLLSMPTKPSTWAAEPFIG